MAQLAVSEPHIVQIGNNIIIDTKTNRMTITDTLTPVAFQLTNITMRDTLISFQTAKRYDVVEETLDILMCSPLGIPSELFN